MEDLRAVSYGHAVSSLGYEVKLGKDELTFKDGKHSVSWKLKKEKDGSHSILRKTRELKYHQHEGAKDQPLGERELAIIDRIVEKAVKVLRLKARFA
jgi:hypothetical protein